MQLFHSLVCSCSFDGCCSQLLSGTAACWRLWFTCCELLEHPLHGEPHEKQAQSSLLNSVAISGHVLSRVTHGVNVPIPPWSTTCTCGVWQIGFLCQKRPLEMTGGQQSLTPSFSPVPSQDASPPLNTVGNHMHKVEQEDERRACNTTDSYWQGMELPVTTLWPPGQEHGRGIIRSPCIPHWVCSPTPAPHPLWLGEDHSRGFFILETWVCLFI